MQPYTDFLPPSQEADNRTQAFGAAEIGRVVAQLASATVPEALVRDLSGGGKASAYGAFAEAHQALRPLPSSSAAAAVANSSSEADAKDALGMLFCSSKLPSCHAARLALEQAAVLLAAEDSAAAAEEKEEKPPAPRVSLGWADCARSKVCTAEHAASAAAEDAEGGGGGVVLTLVRHGGHHIPYHGPPLLCPDAYNDREGDGGVACGAAAVVAELQRMLSRSAIELTSAAHLEQLRESVITEPGPRNNGVVIVGFLDSPPGTMTSDAFHVAAGLLLMNFTYPSSSSWNTYMIILSAHMG